MNTGLHAAPEGFREYDMRWRYPEDVSLEGLGAVGRAVGVWLAESGAANRVVVGHDYRSYSEDVRNSVVGGLVEAGAAVTDIGLALSPTVYFAQFDLGGLPGAVVTASHNPNGWTGLKVSAFPPLTAGPEDMARIRELALGNPPAPRTGGQVDKFDHMSERYLADLARGGRLANAPRVVCATGNGTGGAFAPRLLEALGCDVVDRHTNLDHGFPRYTPNPESEIMLADMGEAVRESGASLALGFDGDGDRIGAVDERGEPIYSDRLGLLVARWLAPAFPRSRFLIDVKSTGLFVDDPILRQHGCSTRFVPTGHAYMKRELQQSGALAGFERSGHFLFAPPLGLGYDDGLRTAEVLLRLLAESGRSLRELAAELPPAWASPNLQPACSDGEKYQVVAAVARQIESMREQDAKLAGRRIAGTLTINGIRANLEGGAWLLIRASSNTPNLVVVAESPHSAEDTEELLDVARGMLAKFDQVDATVLARGGRPE